MMYHVENVDRYLEAIANDSSFNVNNFKDGYGCIQYLVNNIDTFPKVTPNDTGDEKLSKILRRNCRGLKFRLSDGKIVGLPHWKFFNIGEREETLPYNIDFNRPHDLVEKLDGSMIHSFSLDNKSIIWSTKYGVSDTSKLCFKLIIDNNKKYENFALEMAKINHTPIFEFCSPFARIVLDYRQTSLILTEIRNNFTGECLSKESLLSLSSEYDIPLVKFYDYKISDINSFLDSSSKELNKEGYIIRFSGQEKYKVKTDWYRERHRAYSNIIHEKNVIQDILEEKFDDIKSYIDDDLRECAESYEKDLTNHIMDEMKNISEMCNTNYDNDISKKDFVELMSCINPYNKTLYLYYYSSLENGFSKEESYLLTFNNMKKLMIKFSNNSTRLENHRQWFGNLVFSDYINHFFSQKND